MRGLNRWKTPFYYALFESVTLTDDQGNYTGEPRTTYQDPVKAYAHVSTAMGQAQIEVFGTNLQYDRILFLDDPDCPIDENTVLILDGEPQTDDDGNLLYDHVVKRVAKSFHNVLIAVVRVDSETAAEESDDIGETP